MSELKLVTSGRAAVLKLAEHDGVMDAMIEIASAELERRKIAPSAIALRTAPVYTPQNMLRAVRRAQATEERPEWVKILRLAEVELEKKALEAEAKVMASRGEVH